MSVSEVFSSSQHVSQRERDGSCRLCRRLGRTSVIVASPARKLIKCHACGVTFLEPQSEADEISDHLAERYITQDAHVELNFGRWREAVQSRVARQIQRRRQGGRILDIGCAGGYFLNRYFPPPAWKSFGVEPSRFAARIAERKGLTVYRGELQDVQLPSSFFDVVTIFDTISYFREPQVELQAIRRAMRPDGLLVVELPFSSTHIWRHMSLLGRLLGGGPMSLLENGQNFLYDAASMRLLLGVSGFRADEFETLPGNKQRDAFRDFLFTGYFVASRLIWRLSGRSRVLGPNFVVLASPSQTA